MRMSRALAAGVGSSTTLLGAAAAVLLVAGAILAFRGDGFVGVFDHATPLFVDDGPAGAGATGTTGAPPGSAADAAAAAERGVRSRAGAAGGAGPTEAGRPRPDGIRHALATQPATPGGAVLPTSRPQPVARRLDLGRRRSLALELTVRRRLGRWRRRLAAWRQAPLRPGAIARRHGAERHRDARARR